MKSLFFLCVIMLAACQQTPKSIQPKATAVVVFEKVETPAPLEQKVPEASDDDANLALKKEYEAAIKSLEGNFSLGSSGLLDDKSSGDETLVYRGNSETLEALDFGAYEQGWMFDPKDKMFLDQELIKDPLLKAVFVDVDAILIQINKMDSYTQRSFVTALASVAVILRSSVSEDEKQKQAFAAVLLVLDLAKNVGKAIPHVYEAMPTSGLPEGSLDLGQAQRVIELIAFSPFSPLQIKMIGD